MKDSDKKQLYTWIVARYDFILPLTYYDAGNLNGKMTLCCYRDSILDPVVKPWLLDVQQGRINPFTLEEDGDSGYGRGNNTKKDNIVRRQKDENSLKHYFNYPSSPDLAPIENCWQIPK